MTVRAALETTVLMSMDVVNVFVNIVNKLQVTMGGLPAAYCNIAALLYVQYGKIEEMNVCDNLGDHLVGNVYVKV